MEYSNLKAVENIFGWLEPLEGECLYRLAQECSKGVIVEVGSFKGRSTACLGLGSLAGFKVKIYAVDHFQPYFDVILQTVFDYTLEEFCTNMHSLGLGEIVIPIVASSKEAFKTFEHDIGVLFIDACHNFDEVTHDIVSWSTKLLPGGIIAVHDCAPGGNWVEPQRAFNQLVKESPQFQFLGFVGSIGVARKK